MSTNKEVIRFTFDCPAELHTILKMKAAALKQSMKEYLIELVIKDSLDTNKTPKYINEKAFRKQLETILNDDADLMKDLANR